MKKTIIDLFEDSVGKYGGKTFLLEKRHHRFEPTTYAETRELALEVGAGLAASGIRPGDKVAILAEGSNAWIISELGLFYAGAVSVPLSVKLEESNDLLFRLRHAEVHADAVRLGEQADRMVPVPGAGSVDLPVQAVLFSPQGPVLHALDRILMHKKHLLHTVCRRCFSYHRLFSLSCPAARS